MNSRNRSVVLARQRGFTLVEVIVAMVITSIIIGFVSMFMIAPVDAYMDQSERALLNDSSQSISRWMAEDLRAALPNSVRYSNNGTRAIVEILNVSAVSFYRTPGTLIPANPNRELDFLPTDTQFSLFGRVSPNATDYLVIGNLGMGNPGRDAYQLNGVITPVNALGIVRNVVTQEDAVTITSAFRFTAPDTRNRAFIVTGPVTYICNSAANARTLRRYDGYQITSGIPASEASPQLNVAGVRSTTLANNVASCRLSCKGGGSAVCQDALVVEITVERPTTSGPEVLRMFEQFPVDNQ